jgi:hypothetical protein
MELSKIEKLKFSVHDRNAVFAIDMGEMFIRDGVKKLTECRDRKTAPESKQIFTELIDELESISKRLLDINIALVYNFDQKTVSRFAKISDKVLSEVLNKINEG